MNLLKVLLLCFLQMFSLCRFNLSVRWVVFCMELIFNKKSITSELFSSA